MTSLLTPHQVIRELRQQQYKPVYFLQGSEAYYIDSITTYITSYMIPEEEKKLNLITLYDKRQTIKQIILSAQQLPIMGKKKVIIVKEAQKLLDLQKPSSRELLIHYIKKPSTHTLLVFVYKNKSLLPNSSLANILAKGRMLLTCKTPYSSQIPSWIHKYVEEKGYMISKNAALQLQMMVGGNLQVLANELQKIFTNLLKGDHIKTKTINTYIQSSRFFTPFELQQALSHKNTRKISHIVQSFVQNAKKHPITQIISYLTSFFTKTLQLHHKSHKNISLTAMDLQISTYLAPTYIDAIKSYTLAQTLQNIHYLHQADLQTKGIGFPPLSEESILKELITKLLNHTTT